MTSSYLAKNQHYFVGLELIPAGLAANSAGVPQETFTTGLDRTVQWYLDHSDWVKHVITGAYWQWVNQQYGETL